MFYNIYKMKTKNLCKYCHLDGHLIDNCPTIICKICKDIGHPQWLCTKKPKQKSNSSNNLLNTLATNMTNNYNYSIEKNIIIPKNLEYYTKLIDKDWGDIVEIN